MTRPAKIRRAFTLVELLVVITILLVLSGLVLAVFNTGRSSDKMRSAARIAQSAFLGAKDRALHAKDLRGVRLTRDLTNSALVNGFVYLQPLPMLTYAGGSIDLERLDMNQDGIADSSDVVIVRGNSAPATPTVDFDAKTTFFANPGRIRIPSQTGLWYTFTWTTNGPYALSASNECLILQSSYAATPVNGMPAVIAFPNATTLSCDIQLLNDVLPFHQPITLSSSVVIDLNYSSPNVQAIAASSANVDIMFSPRGAVSGYQGGLGPMHFLMRGLKDATAGLNPWIVGGPAMPAANQDKSTEDRMILSVFPQTGLVQIFEIDPTDTYTNPSATTPITSNTGSPDGIADNLFNLAQKGKAAGR